MANKQMPQTNPYDVAVVFLQPQCNMTCTFCITRDNFDAMTQFQALELVDLLKKENFKSIVFGGGEPFEWPGDLLAVMREAKRLGFLVQVGTNAVSLPENFQNIECIDRFVLPLESVSASVHNRMRLYKNTHHQRIMDCLRQLRLDRRCVTLSTIVTKVNQDGLLTLAAFIKELNSDFPFIHAWHLYKFIPEGRGGSVNALELMIPDEDYIRVCGQIKVMDLPFKVYLRQDMYHSKTVDFFWYEQGRLQRGSANPHLTLG